jgi:hypothetical protein
MQMVFDFALYCNRTGGAAATPTTTIYSRQLSLEPIVGTKQVDTAVVLLPIG